MYNNFQKFLQEEIQGIKDAGLYKNERVIVTPQSAAIKTAEAGDVLNFCANNYLGLADSPVLINAAKKALLENLCFKLIFIISPSPFRYIYYQK